MQLHNSRYLKYGFRNSIWYYKKEIVSKLSLSSATRREFITSNVLEEKNIKTHQSIQKQINKRFSYLDIALDDDQDKVIYNKTKDLLLRVLSCLLIDKPPFIGVDNSGQVIAEWHNYRKSKFARVICFSDNNILFQAIHNDDTKINITSNLNSICTELENR